MLYEVITLAHERYRELLEGVAAKSERERELQVQVDSRSAQLAEQELALEQARIAHAENEREVSDVITSYSIHYTKLYEPAIEASIFCSSVVRR